ncbi:MAG: hypothetical protein WEG36_06065 [Gemmatimonadota bacterium]
MNKVLFALLAAAMLAVLPSASSAQAVTSDSAAAQGNSADAELPLWEWDPTDPRIGLAPGLHDGGMAAGSMELIANLPRPEGFSTNSDFAFSGNYAFMGNYNGFNIYDISDPANPALHLSVLCPGNQGDLSVYGNLLFHSVQAASGRLDCGDQGIEDEVSSERFRGVRIFDLSDIDNPVQVAAVQTCRGSHTHSLSSRPGDDENVYIYVSGTSAPRPAEELGGCSGPDSQDEPNTSYFQIEVIQVPLARPQDARIVNQPRVFADPVTGDLAGLWPGGDHGAGTQRTSSTSACHDITTYPEIGLGGGACQGNGILYDITDPTNPVRIHDVVDPNFAYWHSATFNNDGTKVVFTDEWGGGGSPRCRATDPPTWGADALFDIVDGELRLAGYYKLPVPQTEFENCVAHNGSLVPVPGRDIKVQAWYQGGISVFDFTDTGKPFEIAYFDRGPVSVEGRGGGGQWSAYWYNGFVYGSEMARGLDVLRLLPSQHLSQNEIAAALSVRYEQFNAQHQPKIVWPVSFAVTRSYLDQLVRADALAPEMVARLATALAAAEGLPAGNDRRAAADRLVATAAELDAEALAALTAGQTGNPTRVRALLAASLRDLAETLR